MAAFFLHWLSMPWHLSAEVIRAWSNPVPKRVNLGWCTPSQALQHENRFPFSIMHESHSLKWHTFLCKHGKHANTRRHTDNYISVENPSFLLTLVNTWHRDRSTSVHQWSFSLRWRETSFAYVDAVCMETHSQGKPLTCSHAPALCKCQTVRERVYLGAVWYFYTFRAAALSLSLSHTHTHTHTLGLPPLPIQGQTLAFTTSLSMTRKYQEHFSINTNINAVKNLSFLYKVWPNVKMEPV